MRKPPPDIIGDHVERLRRESAIEAVHEQPRPWRPGSVATCPACQVRGHLAPARALVGGGRLETELDPQGILPIPPDGAGVYLERLVLLDFSFCPTCRQLIIAQGDKLVWPRSGRAAPPEVPIAIANDFREAAAVIGDSPRASAALSRRCLQSLLRDVAGVNPGDLWVEINQVLPALPSHLRELDAIRNVGNFAAHPNKDKQTGDVLPVEPGEAEWLLDILEGLFDHYCVAPARAKQRQAALDQKLASAGKPPMKT